MALRMFFSRWTVWQKWLAALVVVFLLLLAIVALFPWNLLREPINRAVSAQLGRRFEITRHLDIRLGRSITVVADGIELDNPEWARDPLFLKADAAEIDIRLWPLLSRRVVMPRVLLTRPEINLQSEADGRRNWVFTSDSKAGSGTPPEVGVLLVDTGKLTYLAKAQGADLSTQFSLAAESAADLPLSFRVTGKWKDQALRADGRAGGVLRLTQNLQGRFPLELTLVTGNTRLQASGSVTDLANLSALDARFDLQGNNLEELYKLAGVVLPSTPAYKLRGNLRKEDARWDASDLQGTLGKTDLRGTLSFDQSKDVPRLTGRLQSKLLDFADLAPVVGLPAAGSKTVAAEQGGALPARQTGQKKASRTPGGKVLPDTKLDIPRLNAMHADVTYTAERVIRAPSLPLERGSVHVKLDDGVLQLDPLSLGVAGGTVAGSIRVDSNNAPASLTTRLDVRGLQLNRLFPAIERSKSSLGKISGQIDLNGRGQSTAQMLASASGDVSVLMGPGQFSNLLLEFMGLDGAEIIKFLITGDATVRVRCAVTAFDVKQGLMTSRAIVLDTEDTVVRGQGTVNLATEAMNIRLEPEPKDMSILSLRSPLQIGGTFGAPAIAPDKTALLGRGALALALGVINPLLALAATVETGPGENADCRNVFAEGQAARPRAGSIPTSK
jgi:AsmA family protein